MGALASLVGGSVVGTILTLIVSARRNRVQPVGFRAEPLPLFQGVTGNRNVRIRVSLEDGGVLHNLENLHAIDVEVINRGNADRAKFSFGITLPITQQAVAVETVKGDRHHVFTEVPSVSPTAPSNELDFVVQPFNRGDRYRLTAYITLPPGQEMMGDIEFTSSESVVFTPMSTTGEFGMTIAKVAANSVLGIGGVRVSFGKNGPYVP